MTTNLLENVISSEWDDKVVNVEYLAQILRTHLMRYVTPNDNLTVGQFGDLILSELDSPVAIIINLLEPELLSDGYFRGQWVEHTRKDVLRTINKRLLNAFLEEQQELNEHCCEGADSECE